MQGGSKTIYKFDVKSLCWFLFQSIWQNMNSTCFFDVFTFILTNYNYKQLASLAKAVAFTYPIFLLLTNIYLIRWYENIHWNNGNCSKLTRKVMLINTYSLSSQCNSRCFIVFNRGYILFRLPDNFVLTQLIDTEWVNFVSLL